MDLKTGATYLPLDENDFIVAGIVNLDPNPLDSNVPQLILIEKVIIHQNYTNDGKSFDYSIVKLTDPLDFNTNVKPACLPTPDFVSGNVTVASGWGKLTGKFAIDFHISSLESRNNQRDTLVWGLNTF